jgi:hypothetical protein
MVTIMTEETLPRIVWEPPAPRSGILGSWDTFIGPGATPAESRLIWLTAVGGGVLAFFAARNDGVTWTPWQWLIALLMALDLFGGVAANASSATKRWYHRSGQGSRHHLTFIAYHIYPFLVAWLFRDGDWTYAVLVYGYLLLAAVLLLQTPFYLKRPTALALYLLGMTIPWLLISQTAGLIWFVPVLYLKLIVCHLVPEAPFRPKMIDANGIP